MTRLGLHMIVKNESAVIEDCLTRVRPLIDWWVVCDTGSTDGTQDLVRSVLADLPGELVERPWVSFGHNRQEALEAARGLEHSRPGDYVLWIDADEWLVDVPDELPELSADGYVVEVAYDDVRYDRMAVVRLDSPWRWTGVVHEYLDQPGATRGRLTAPRVLVHHTGARAQDPDTYRKDAALIAAELRDAPDDPRSQFYLAQSFRDAGQVGLALKAFQMRMANPAGWDQERWFAGFQAAMCLEALDRPPDAVRAAYLASYSERPTRAEPLVELARFERLGGRFAVALIYARAAAAIPLPPREDIFVDHGVHTWRVQDEIAVSCWQVGLLEEGLAAAEAALAARPDDERLAVNLRYFTDARDGADSG